MGINIFCLVITISAFVLCKEGRLPSTGRGERKGRKGSFIIHFYGFVVYLVIWPPANKRCLIIYQMSLESSIGISDH